MSGSPIISTQPALEAFVEALQGCNRLAIDTEFMRESSYYPLLCLIQICADEHSVCIDALAVADLSPLGALLAAPDKISILHSCRQDLEALETRFNVRIDRLFDTQIAAAFCGYGSQVSYAALVQQACGQALPKLFTRTDWRRRPLSDGQVRYALDDVDYLLPVYELLREQLHRNGRAAWHAQECAQILDGGDYRPDSDTVADAWKKLKGAGRLPLAAQPCAKALAQWREQLAIRLNRPREWILSTRCLLQISRLRPTTPARLAGVEKLPAGFVKRWGKQIVEIVLRHRDNAAAEPVWKATTGKPAAKQEELARRLMRELKQIAEDNHISQTLICNHDEIKRLAGGERQVPVLQGWRHTLAGEALLAVVNR